MKNAVIKTALCLPVIVIASIFYLPHHKSQKPFGDLGLDITVGVGAVGDSYINPD